MKALRKSLSVCVVEQSLWQQRWGQCTSDKGREPVRWKSSGPEQPEHLVLLPCPPRFPLASRGETQVPLRPEWEAGAWATTCFLFPLCKAEWQPPFLSRVRPPDSDVSASAAPPASGTDFLPAWIPSQPFLPAGFPLQRPAFPVLRPLA